MKPEIKQLWIDALRSGEYVQGRGCLKKENNDSSTYCCLGVLCDLHQKHTHGGQWHRLNANMYWYVPNNRVEDRNEAFLPPCVQDWAGMYEQSPNVLFNEKNMLLSSLNDGSYNIQSLDPVSSPEKVLSFTQIADLIEASL